MKKISVLMSVYAKEKGDRLQLAIDSILNQTYSPSEFVLVKDGPLGLELDEIINKYVNNNATLFNIVTIEKNVGLGEALRIGLENCSCEYVARMDSDDESLPNRFEKQIRILEENPEIDLVGSNILEFDENMETKLFSRNVPQSDEEIKKFIKSRNPVNHVSVIYKKDAALRAGNYMHCPYFEDYYLWARMQKNGAKFYNIQEPLVNVRAGNNMCKRRGGLNYIRHIVDFQKKIYKIGIINRRAFAYNVLIRVAASIMPNKFRMILYKNKLRNKIVEE